MSIFNFKGLVDSVTSVLSGSSYETQQNPSSSNSTTMDGVAAGLSVSNERAAYKLKGYLDLATEVIAKAVRAEEWGLVDDAVAHYQNAQRILTEAYSTPVSSYISFRYQEFFLPRVFFFVIYVFGQLTLL